MRKFNPAQAQSIKARVNRQSVRETREVDFALLCGRGSGYSAKLHALYLAHHLRIKCDGTGYARLSQKRLHVSALLAASYDKS